MDKDLLANIPLFAKLNDEELVELAALLKEERVASHSPVFWIGEEGSDFYLLQVGRVTVNYPDDTGREVTIAVLGPGDFFGEISLLDGGPGLGPPSIWFTGPRWRVSRILFPSTRCARSGRACPERAKRVEGGDHFSCPGVAAGLFAAYPRRLGRLGPRLDAYLALLPVGFAVPRMSPPARCALTAPFHPCWRSCLLLAVSFCCTFRRIAPPRGYRAPCPVQFGLSSREVPLPGVPRAITAAAASQLTLYVLRVAEF